MSGDGATVTAVVPDLKEQGLLVSGALTRGGDATDEVFVIIKVGRCRLTPG